MLILPLIAFLIPALFGVSLLASLQLFKEKTILALVGTIAGLAIFTTAIFLANLLIPLTAISVVSVLSLCALATVLIIFKSQVWPHWQRLTTDKTALIILFLLFILFGIIAPKLLIDQPGGLYTGIINAYGDIAWHLANITAFTEGQSLPPQNPIFADTRLTYPFLTNLFSASLLVLGATFSQSVNLPALILIPILLTLVYLLTREFTPLSKLAKRAGIIALLLFLFGGATLGFTRLWGDWQEANVSFWEFITHLPARDYSGVGSDQQGFHFLNPTTTLLLPQRSFLFGLPLAMSILLLLHTAIHTDRQRTAAFFVAGLLAGILPLFHAHTVLALIPAIITLFLLNIYHRQGSVAHTTQGWLLFVLSALVIGIPEVLYYARGVPEHGSFFRWHIGWMADQENLIWYWLKNTGLLIPAAVAGLFLRAPRQLKVLAAAGLFLFIIANLFLFAPWAWDNFKLFVYFFLFILPLVGYTAAKLAGSPHPALLRATVIILIGIHLISAGFDILKLALPTALTWNEWDQPAIAMAAKIKQATQPGESILTAPIHNSPTVLAGRPQYLGYAAHVWSHGGSPWDREDAIQPFYEGTRQILPETSPDYVLVGPVERSKYPSLTIRDNWELVAQERSYSLYRIIKF